MRVVVAFDKFKGSLTAAEACAAAARGIRSARPDADIVEVPLADGGEGTAETLRAAWGGEWVRASVSGPLPGLAVDAAWAWFAARRLAVVEMARASGLALVPPGRRDPLGATTRGTGELLVQAFARGAPVWLAVGGSATVDGGLGLALALGWRFLDAHGADAGEGGAALERIARIVPPPHREHPRVDVLCDVDNPLLGPQGAARVFGPQKGASPEAVERLEAGLANLAGRVRDQFGVDIASRSGGGAAGGLAGGAAAFLGARLVRGAERVIEAAGLGEALRGARRVVTGEGSFDGQSLRGKVVAGVAREARRAGVRVSVIAGQVRLGDAEWKPAGIEESHPLVRPGIDADEAMRHAARHLETAARAMACAWDN